MLGALISGFGMNCKVVALHSMFRNALSTNATKKCVQLALSSS